MIRFIDNILFRVGFLSSTYFHWKNNLYFDFRRFKTQALNPNFLILGAMKAGTTSLYRYLRQHPDIFASVFKESGYFLNPSDNKYRPYYKSPNEIRRHFDDTALLKRMLRGYTNEKMIGEASTHYTKVPEFGAEVPQKCREINPNMKFIYLLRNPLDRMISHYLHALRGGFASAKFNQIIREDDTYHYFSLYHFQIAKYLEYFDKSQFKLIIFEEFIQNPMPILQEIANFFEISPFEPKNLTLQIHNASELKNQIDKSEILFSKENFGHFKQIFEEDTNKLLQTFPLPLYQFWQFEEAKYVLPF
ncbi:MAG: sulfotransferase [Microscillaceae bacterium]|jgi:hypothetical protein|nr:sulfotransferase [Microscillaceae bacterium]